MADKTHAESDAGRPAVVLLSGGLDSTTCLAVAQDQGFEVQALTVDYGQLNTVELDAARRVAEALGVVEHLELPFDLGFLHEAFQECPGRFTAGGDNLHGHFTADIAVESVQDSAHTAAAYLSGDNVLVGA